MKLRAVYLVSLTILLNKSAALRAQPDSTRNAPNPTVVSMIRVTLDFLATDEKAFGKKSNPVCKPCTSYNELTAFAKENHLLKADGLINDARKKAQQAINSDPNAMPGQLRIFLINRVINGKGYRKQLPTFAAFQQNLNTIAGGQPTPITDVPTSDNEAEQETTDLATGTADATMATNDTTYQSNTTPKSFLSMDQISYLPIIALILSIISLTGVAILWKRGRSIEIADLIQSVKSLENQTRNLSKELNDLKKGSTTARNVVQQPPSQTQQSQNRPQPAQPPVSKPELVAPVAEVPPVVPAQSTPPTPANTFRQAPVSTPTLLYGRTADLGDGFSTKELSSKPDRDTVFEIHRQTDTQALFQVSDQPDLQRLALSDPYSYLNDTCSYQMQPRPGSRIQTEKPGKLSLQGDKWAIVEKAQISFTS